MAISVLSPWSKITGGRETAIVSQAGFDGQRPQVRLGRGECLRMARSRKYPQELRERAVRTVLESGRPIAQVAKDLGIGSESLRAWVRQAQADAGERTEQLTTLEGEELKRLRGENRELRRANEILKAASVFFASELDSSRTR